MGERTPNVRDGDLAETLGYLAEVIASRRDADPSESYTAKLLQGGVERRRAASAGRRLPRGR